MIALGMQILLMPHHTHLQCPKACQIKTREITRNLIKNSLSLHRNSMFGHLLQPNDRVLVPIQYFQCEIDSNGGSIVLAEKLVHISFDE